MLPGDAPRHATASIRRVGAVGALTRSTKVAPSASASRSRPERLMLASTGLTLSAGEVVTLIGTVAMAAEIILIGIFAGTVDLGRVTVLQLLVAGGLSLALMPIAGESVPSFSWIWLVTALGLGAASCLIQLTMNWAQRSVSPTRATVIYAGEPVWGGAVGRLAGDRLAGLAVVRAARIVAGVLVSELEPPSRTRPVKVPSPEAARRTESEFPPVSERAA